MQSGRVAPVDNSRKEERRGGEGKGREEEEERGGKGKGRKKKGRKREKEKKGGGKREKKREGKKKREKKKSLDHGVKGLRAAYFMRLRRTY